MRTAYLDCFSGISGNMLIGALLDAGLEHDFPAQVAHDLGLRGVDIRIRPHRSGHLTGTHVEVHLDQDQPCRHLADLQHIITRSPFAEQVRQQSLAVFDRLAKAEARVHGISTGDVHFHEVGAADALIDVVTTVAGLHRLQVTRLVCSPLPLSNGWTICSHGPIPLPAPAVPVILQGVPVIGVELNMELVTPTGAALVRELAHEFGPLPSMTIAATGFGAGSNQRPDQRPNLLRIIIGQPETVDEAQEVEILTTLIDDWNPETWPHVSDLLLKRGALDVHLCPVLMKKGRPGHRLEVVCRPETVAEMEEIIFRETTTIGLRRHRVARRTLKRWPVEVHTALGPVQAKAIQTPDGIRVTPEYESCRGLAQTRNVPLNRVYEHVRQAVAEHPVQEENRE